MDITAIDRSAVTGTSLLHTASVGSKLAALSLVLATVVVSTNPLLLMTCALAISAAALLARVPFRLLVSLALYPGLFAALFAFASAPSMQAGVTIVLKAIVAASSVVLLVLSTPYPAVFSAVQRIVPSIVGDAMLMTYRSFFLLMDRFSHLLTAVRLRSASGRGRLVTRTRAVSSALANTLLYAFDLAERDYDVLYLRGYSGRLRSAPPRRHGYRGDTLTLAGATALSAIAGVWRFGSSSLDPYSWIPLASSALILSGAAIWRWARGTTA